MARFAQTETPTPGMDCEVGVGVYMCFRVSNSENCFSCAILGSSSGVFGGFSFLWGQRSKYERGGFCIAPAQGTKYRHQVDIALCLFRIKEPEALFSFHVCVTAVLCSWFPVFNVAGTFHTTNLLYIRGVLGGQGFGGIGRPFHRRYVVSQAVQIMETAVVNNTAALSTFRELGAAEVRTASFCDGFRFSSRCADETNQRA